MILAVEPFTLILNYNKIVSVSSGTDVVMTVLLSGKSTTPNYINVSDITTGGGTTVTLGYGPNTAAYSCDIHLSASGGGHPYTIAAIWDERLRKKSFLLSEVVCERLIACEKKIKSVVWK